MKKKIVKQKEVLEDKESVEKIEHIEPITILSTDLGRGDLNELRDKLNELITKFNGR